MASACPRCGSHSISVSETATSVTHTCNKCGYSETRIKGKYRACLTCDQPITRCTHRRCVFFGWVHLRTNLHRCGRSGLSHARGRR